MPLTLPRKSPSRKSTLTTGPANGSPLAEGLGAQPKQTNTVTSAPRTRLPLPRASTDGATPTLARKPSDSSIYSTASKVEKKRSAWRGVAKTLPSLLKSSRGASSTSLVGQDGETPMPTDVVEIPKSSPSTPSKIPKRMTPSPKATLVEPRNSQPIKGQDTDERASAEYSDGSLTMVDEVQPTGLPLSEELSSLRQQLTETTNECSALREHISTLEGTSKAQLRQSVEEAVNHTKAELLRAHSSELDKHRETIQSLHKRNEDLASRVMVAEDTKADSARAHDTEMQSLQFRMKNLQQSLEVVQHDLKMKDEHTSKLERENNELRGRTAQLEENGRVLAQGGAAAQTRLLDEVNQYRQKLETSQQTLAERDAQVQQLQSSKLEADNMLIKAQAVVDEKDMAIGELKARVTGYEERNASLEGRVVEMERELTETKNAADQTLQAKIAEYERQLTDAHRTAEALRAELTSSSTTIQQLRTALNTARADAQISATTIEEHATQLRQARKQHTMLEDTARALEEEKETLEREKGELVRAHIAQIEAERRAVHNLRKSMESSQRDLAAKQERTSILVTANEELRREVLSLKEKLTQDGEASLKVRKELDEVKATLSTLEEKSQATAELAQDKEKLVNEVAQLKSQLEDARKQLNQLTTSPQVQAEEELKGDLKKAQATVDEQKTVIGRLQQTLDERMKEEPSPRLPPSLTRISPAQQRPTTQRSRSATISVTESPRPASSSPKPPAPAHVSLSRRTTPSSSPIIPHSSPLKKSSTSPSRRPTSSSSKVANEQDRAFRAGSTDSDSDGGHSTTSSGAARRQSNTHSPTTDVKLLRPSAEPTLAYKMGHAVFGSLWRRIWG
ncbi:hypothetical protein NP233_g9120 [Leucocoprinus birnbaumii]|uniref:Uncharacterized protein n=1 Tax=Leucocoprinus birnbaumii TaxID=56174 RepID=A0AAD5VL68_9AGAR|nr:hypothetical protein NP233_g9120 [Leucocoprinus birnbaumii]